MNIPEDKAMSNLLLVGLSAVGIAFLAIQLMGCVSFPLPPTGDAAGKYGYIDVRVTYRPNFQTIVDSMRRPNPDLATLRDK
jgi:hypothetical protein